jgi:uncharacterized glyoxalase superfamily metalloenzyme YdcJ
VNTGSVHAVHRERWELRAAFARSLSQMYGREVPAYTTLVEVAEQVNADVLARDGDDAQRLGSISRVTAERHGAIRLGTPAEMRDVARVFAAVGMVPVGFYDLRDASSSSVPVVSTAFRPTDRDELTRNPFRVFTSLLTADDDRFFTPDVQAGLTERLSRRQLFGLELLGLADRSVADDGLAQPDADRFIALATAVFELATEPVDRAWYSTLEAISGVAADIGGVGSTHINHLTPRVLDIDELYRRMTERGVTMIDEIQGPPRWDGPDVLLRQTSFKALAEPRIFAEADGSLSTGALRVRFGEVEARGIALTRAGRELYDRLLLEVDRRLAESGGVRAEHARDVWAQSLPGNEDDLDRAGLGFFTYRLADAARSGHPAERTLDEMVTSGTVAADPIVYEDFLPRSAAGIFQSNLDDTGSRTGAHDDGGTHDDDGGDGRDLAWMSGMLDRDVADPMDLYAAQRGASLQTLGDQLGVDPSLLTRTDRHPSTSVKESI